MKKKPKYNQNSVIRGALRRAFARSPAVQEVMQASRREVPRYTKDGSRHKKNWVQRECQVCNNWVSSSKMAVDHIEPVISVTDGFQDWNEFIARLWCDPKNLQRICDDCHDKKTNQERYDRDFKKYLERVDHFEGIIKDYGNHIEELQFHLPFLKKEMTKFTPKKLANYPKNFQDRVMALKEIVKRYKDVIKNSNLKEIDNV